MRKYVLKRILIFIPTIFIISLLTFMISLNAPGDPVEFMLNIGNEQGQMSDRIATEKTYLSLRKQLGLDLPVFYFSFTNLASCDTLYRIPKKRYRQNLERLTDIHGNWKQIESYFLSCRVLENELYKVQKNAINSSRLLQMKDNSNALLVSYKENKIKYHIDKIDKLINSHVGFKELQPFIEEIKFKYNVVVDEATPNKKLIPVLRFHGFNNQYHNWITNFIIGDFGISYQDKRPVKSVIWDALGWTMLISLLSVLIAYLIAIPVGVFSAVKRGTKFDLTVSTILFMLYSLPSFWMPRSIAS